jgi:hypothetical protein
MTAIELTKLSGDSKQSLTLSTDEKKVTSVKRFLRRRTARQILQTETEHHRGGRGETVAHDFAVAAGR